ncbi:MAG TPA: phosphoribosylformylglycinamidine synthase, partial [Clostridia bacterium]
YDIEGISDEEYNEALNTIFSEPPVDNVFSENIELSGKVFAIEYLPGQYDQRADSAAQCVQILSRREKPRIRVAKLIVLEGDVSDEEYNRVKDYCINPVESREASMDKPKTIETEVEMPSDVSVIEGFIKMTESDLSELMASMGFAMSLEDLKFCQNYFRDTEKRNPTVTEIRMIDTYWSDHCRHTTFLTEIEDVKFEGYGEVIKKAYESYRASREYVYGDKAKERDVCLMDMATIAMKELRKKGLLDDLDVSDEINACSICVNVDVDGKEEEWLVMFKNETHNHPTEIEPFGGAATCLGGAIRDPLSGRSYVYQAMRVTGSGDPRTSVKDTLQGKLPQRKITTGAASGYSSYGNQIGLATGQVAEIYDEGYVAKRMEIGAVIGAAPKSNVVREVPEAGDIIILLGGRTGRDGCGGATGSSKEHDEESLVNCGAEVQKGNPPTERKIQRLFRKQEVSTLIKRCNDFGAGGVSVAIGELADGLIINLDAVPIKYEGIDGTELAISESQERMAVVVSSENVKAFINAADEENLEATEVAVVTAEPRLRMIWRGKTIVDIGRDFLNTNGVKQKVSVEAALPQEGSYFNKKVNEGNLETLWTKNLSNLNVCSQKGLVERFDATIGAGTVTMPFGGKYQLSPAEGMAAKVPVPGGKTNT